MQIAMSLALILASCRRGQFTFSACAKIQLKHQGEKSCPSRRRVGGRDFWGTWDRVAESHKDDPKAELDAYLEWIGERVGRLNYRGCPQINVAAEFPEADHPARKVAADHKREMRRRLRDIAERLAVARPDDLAGQLALLIMARSSARKCSIRGKPRRFCG